MHQLFTSRSRRSQQQWPWAILLLLIVLASPALLSPVESAGIAGKSTMRTHAPKKNEMNEHPTTPRDQ